MGSIAAWYRHPDQELLRREARWALRWMTRGWGAVWMAFFTLCHVGVACLSFSASEMGMFAPYLVSLVAPLSLVNWVVSVGMIRSRSLRLFEPGSLRHLYMTSLRVRDLWPALLAAPMAFTTATGLIQGACSIPLQLNTLAAIRSGNVFPMKPAGGAVALPYDPMEMFEPKIYLSLAAANFATMFVLKLALTAFSAWRCFPTHAAAGRIALWQIFGYILCYAPCFVIQISGTVLIMYYAATAGRFSTFISWFMRLNAILGTGAFLAASAGLLWVSLWQLRKPWQWERLRLATERWR